MTKIVAVSDLHGHFPDIPKCDLLLIAGDILLDAGVVDQLCWLEGLVRPWLEKIPAKEVVFVAGNHDTIYEEARGIVPATLPWHYLQDSGVELFRLKIWGSPWQKRFNDWSFNTDEEHMTRQFGFIPDDTDIVVTHSPPFGIRDYVPTKTKVKKSLGSTSLRKRMFEVRPKLHVFGHIHHAQGKYIKTWKNKTTTVFANVSYVGENYRPMGRFMEIEL